MSVADQLLVSTRKGLFTFAREGGGWRLWRKAFTGENVTLAMADRRAGWFAALNLGHFGVKLRHSADQGEKWEERTVPAYPEGETIATGDGKPPKPANLKLLWALEVGAGGCLWAGTLPGGLFRSDDGGRSWKLTRSLWDAPDRAKWFGGGADLPGIHSICVDPRDARVLRLAVSCGGVWLSEDDGTTWRNVGEGLRAEYMPPELQRMKEVQDPHRMVQCHASPDHLWIQHHNGVFRSCDGGLHWDELTNVPPSVFGFGVVVHPREPGTAWFVPAVKDECRVPVDGKLVVARTRDGGKTFEVLRKGLPQENAYDLVYRHALAIDESGDRLAMGSTTGGLWMTEDQGDTWRTVEARLPPVHAVCFA
jgi:hypothetical protein